MLLKQLEEVAIEMRKNLEQVEASIARLRKSSAPKLRVVASAGRAVDCSACNPRPCGDREPCPDGYVGAVGVRKLVRMGGR